jgi:thiamine-monophosphate kinase
MAKLDEFALIARYFSRPYGQDSGVSLGIGDDGAILEVPKEHKLVTSIDTLVAGVHFPHNSLAFDTGYKALAVNLSDLAAMAAKPAWFTLSLTLPQADPDWLADFSRGLFSLAQQHDLVLVGGDTSRGPLSITIQVMGWLPDQQRPLLRSGAQPGDHIYVSGCLGDAALALARELGDKTTVRLTAVEKQQLAQRLHRPQPRVALGLKLAGTATSAIDISDGLLADLGHIVDASGVSAWLDLEDLPLSSALTKLGQPEAWRLALTGGDDYQLCFTAPADQATNLANWQGDYALWRIGKINPGAGISYDREKLTGALVQPGYRHF